MPAVAPEADVAHSPAIRRVGLETGELGVGGRFAEEAGGEQRRTGDVEEPWKGRARQRRRRERHRDEEQQRALEPEDGEGREPDETRPPSFAHRAVAVVLALSAIAGEDVEREAQAPHPHQQHHEEPPRRLARPQPGGDQRDQDEARSPHHVDDARIAQADARQPAQQEIDRHERRGVREHGTETHAPPLSGAPQSSPSAASRVG